MRSFLAALLLLVATLPTYAALPPIVEAAKSGNREAIRMLLQKGANANDADGDGSTALHWAAYLNDAQAVDMLLRAGAKPNAASDLGVTALWNASQNGSDAIVKRLLDAGANPNLALLSGETPLMVAARGGYAAVAQLLIGKGANANAKGTRSQTALMWAAAQKHPEVMKVLLAAKPDIHAKSAVWSEMQGLLPHSFYNKSIPHGGETALMFAARSGDAESTRLLLAAGANANDTDAWGVSATTLAAHSNFGDVAEVLLNAGADPNAMKAGFSALHNAVMWRNNKLVTALLARGADPNARLETWTPQRRTADDRFFGPALVGATPLWLAARFLAPDVMKTLLDRGADPKFVLHADYVPEGGMNKDGVYPHRKFDTTPLMAALGMGGGDFWVPVEASQKEALTLEAVKLALASGVDINLANTDGKTALDAARTLRYNGVIALLTEGGAKAGTPVAPANDVAPRTGPQADPAAQPQGQRGQGQRGGRGGI
jgi:ankyrin repeat protein